MDFPSIKIVKHADDVYVLLARGAKTQYATSPEAAGKLVEGFLSAARLPVPVEPPTPGGVALKVKPEKLADNAPAAKVGGADHSPKSKSKSKSKTFGSG